MDCRITIDRATARGNCTNCGSLLYIGVSIPNGYGASGETDLQFSCPRCASVWGVDSANDEFVNLELVALQNEHKSKTKVKRDPKPKREAIYADPVLGPIRRAQDRIAAAERDLATALAEAHHEHNRSVRGVADAVGLKKSRTHELIQRGAETYALRKKRHQPRTVITDPLEITF